MMAKTCLPPGFRFHPTDVELVWYYLKRKITGKPCRFEAISEVQVYKFAPWDLPDKSCLVSKDLEWYFFCARDRKYTRGSRTNRATDTGYWKPTGRDRSIDYNSKKVGMKKTLIFHLGKFPKGTRTDWVMYEYRLDSSELANAGYAQDAYVICKIFEKSGRGPRNGAQYGAPFNEEDWEDDTDMEDTPINNFEVGEPSCMQRQFEVGESSAMTCNLEAGEAYADSLSLKEVETFLLAETANVDQMPDMNFENFFGLSDPSCLEPNDGIAISDIQPEFVDEHYDDIFNDYFDTDVDGYFAPESPLKQPSPGKDESL